MTPNTNIKQHITDEQFCKLNEDARIKWARMIAKKDNLAVEDIDYIDTAEHTTIGRMIEFLDDKGLKNWKGTLVGGNLPNPYWIMKNEKAYNFCDALWEVVKEILNYE